MSPTSYRALRSVLDIKTSLNATQKSEREFDAMGKEINMMCIQFAETNVLLGNIKLSESFKEQVKIVSRVNISKVRYPPITLIPLDRDGLSSQHWHIPF